MTGLVFAAIAATPAMANTYHSYSSRGSTVGTASYGAYTYAPGNGAYAFAGPAVRRSGPYGVNGWDPDPSIRLQLRRDDTSEGAN